MAENGHIQNGFGDLDCIFFTATEYPLGFQEARVRTLDLTNTYVRPNSHMQNVFTTVR